MKRPELHGTEFCVSHSSGPEIMVATGRSPAPPGAGYPHCLHALRALSRLLVCVGSNCAARAGQIGGAATRSRASAQAKKIRL